MLPVAGPSPPPGICRLDRRGLYAECQCHWCPRRGGLRRGGRMDSDVGETMQSRSVVDTRCLDLLVRRLQRRGRGGILCRLRPSSRPARCAGGRIAARGGRRGCATARGRIRPARLPDRRRRRPRPADAATGRVRPARLDRRRRHGWHAARVGRRSAAPGPRVARGRGRRRCAPDRGGGRHPGGHDRRLGRGPPRRGRHSRHRATGRPCSRRRSASPPGSAPNPVSS